MTTISSDFKGFPFDGILGLAFPVLSAIGKSPFFHTAFKEGVANSFGIRVESGRPQLHVGGGAGGDQHLYKGSIEEHPVDSSKGYWQLKGASVLVGETVVVSGIDTLLDSGSKMIYGPADQVRPDPLYCQF